MTSSKTSSSEADASPQPPPTPPAETSDSGHEEAPDLNETVATLRRHIAQLQEYLIHYALARIDSARLSMRHWLVGIALLMMMLLAGVGLIVTAVVLVCAGIADALSVLFHSQWVGELITGVGLLAGVIAMTFLVVHRIYRDAEAKTFAKFEARLRHRLPPAEQMPEAPSQSEAHDE